MEPARHGVGPTAGPTEPGAGQEVHQAKQARDPKDLPAGSESNFVVLPPDSVAADHSKHSHSHSYFVDCPSHYHFAAPQLAVLDQRSQKA